MTKVRDKQQTIAVYNQNALKFTQGFDQIGARVEEIRRSFFFIKKANPKVIEIGCGSGRDAGEIIKYTHDYLGIDLSPEMIQLARLRVPQAKFQVADLEVFEFPKATDIIFAFASLLHSDKESVGGVLSKAYGSVNHGGVFLINLMYGKYRRRLRDKNTHDSRVFYLYTPEKILQLAPAGFASVYKSIYKFKGLRWFNLILQKRYH